MKPTIVSSRIAKLTRPGASGALARERLFSLLDDGWGRPVTWVSGPGGAGKTTLVASWLDARSLPCLWYQVDEGDADIATFFYYMGQAAAELGDEGHPPLPLLTPEYLLGIPAFTRRWFENLFNRLNLPHTLILDNYQTVAGSSFHEMLSHGLDVIPEGVRVVVLSRQEPPPQLARLRANGRVQQLGWDDVRLTVDESAEFVRLFGGNGASKESVVQLHEKANGWAAGLLLMIESARRRKLDYSHLAGMEQREVFDYFAAEVYDRADEETRRLLLRTSFLPFMSQSMAGKLSGVAQAGEMLAHLSDNHYFTERRYTPELVYQYHPLFAEFLQARAKRELSSDEIAALRKKTASLLAEAGQHDAAAWLFRDSSDMEGLVGLILGQAPAMMMQGRNKTLEEWICFIPDETLDTLPWLLYWRGVCRLFYAPALARVSLEQAFHLFEKQGDDAGILLAWAGVAGCFFCEWNDFTPLDYWIDWLDEWTVRKPSFPSPQIEARVATSMAGALLLRRPQHPDATPWIERAMAMTRQHCPDLYPEACFYAGIYYCWMGVKEKFTATQEILTSVTISPNALPYVKMQERLMTLANVLWMQVVAAQTIQVLDEAVEIARSTGIHIWDHLFYSEGVNASHAKGDLPLAADYLKKMAATLVPARRHGYCHYHYLAAWNNLLLGNAAAAFSSAETALAIAVETGMVFAEVACRLELAMIAHEIGEDRRAAEECELAGRIARDIRSTGLEFSYLMAKALIDLDIEAGDETKRCSSLRDAMALGREQGYISMIQWWYAPMMSKLCAKALEEGIEPEYARMLVKVRNLPPPEGQCPEIWPYPVRIHTLGRFELMVDDKRVGFSGKVQKKPLELLKALIAFGGEEVSEELLSDALWPDADGDAAHNAFKFALHSLRKMISHPDALKLSGGRLSLDRRICWVDAVALNHILDQARDGVGARKKSPSAKGSISCLHEKVCRLYRGEFLPGDDSSWAIAARERIRDRIAALPGAGELKV